MALRTAGHASAVGEARYMKTVAYSYDVLPRWVLHSRSYFIQGLFTFTVLRST